MVAPNAASLTRYRAAVAKTLLETVHNTRTDQDMFCRLRPAAGIQISGLEEFEPYPTWDFICAWDANLKQGDTLTSAARGTLRVFSIKRDSTFDYDTTATVALLEDASGASQFATNAHVTFQERGKPKTQQVTADVWIRPVGDDLRLQGDNPAYDWDVHFSVSLSYPDGNRIGAGDSIIWAELGQTSLGTGRGAAISNPRPVTFPLPLVHAMFKESP